MLSVPPSSNRIPNNSGQVPNVPRQAVKFSHIRLTDRVSLILFKNGLLNEEFSMSSAAKGKALPALYEYFNQPRPQKKKMGWEEIAETRMNIVVGFCTHCGARMRLVEIIPESFHQRIRAPDVC